MQPPLAIVGTYNDRDIFPQVLDGLLRDGMHVHVMDNWSSDSTYEVIRDVASEQREAVSLERFPDSGPGPYFDLRAILRRKEKIAAQFPGRWISNQDSDEVRCSPWPAVSFHEGLRRVSAEGSSAIEFAVVIFRPVDEDFRPGTDPESHFRFFERGLSSVRHVKAWSQPTMAVDLASTGGHDTKFPGRRVYPEKFILKHYPIRNPVQGRRKIFAERLPRFHPAERAVGMHVHYDNIPPVAPLVWNPGDLLEWGRDSAVMQEPSNALSPMKGQS